MDSLKEVDKLSDLIGGFDPHEVPVRMASTKKLTIKVIRNGRVWEFPACPERKFSLAYLKFWIYVKRWNFETKMIRLKQWYVKWRTS